MYVFLLFLVSVIFIDRPDRVLLKPSNHVISILFSRNKMKMLISGLDLQKRKQNIIIFQLIGINGKMKMKMMVSLIFYLFLNVFHSYLYIILLDENEEVRFKLLSLKLSIHL